MDASAELQETFFAECDELIQSLEAGLADLRDGVGDEETVNAVFRAAHSIKGGAAAFGMERLVEAAHRFETALARIRDAAAPPPAFALDVFLQATDMLADLVAATRAGGPTDQIPLGPVLARLDAVAGVEAGDGDAPAAYLVRFRPRDGLYRRGHEPTLLLRALRELGPCETTLDAAALAPLERLRPGDAGIGWTIRIETTAPRDEIEEIFEFVAGDCDLAIEPAAPAPAAKGRPPRAAPSAGPAAPARTVRVDVARIERVINLAGELSIAQGALAERLAAPGPQSRGALADAMDAFRALTRDIQESVLAIRAQPLTPLFQRMARIVRETAEAAGKSVRLVVAGGETEVDRTIVEGLAEPLTHMIRNAIDHGIERPAARAAAGKPEEGLITLTARHRSGRVVIEIADDGAGVDRARVRAAAEAKGLVARGDRLTEAEIDNLIFAPGFSTAAAVTDLSGRGVGLDVVRTAIQGLGGRASFSSTAGAGAAFAISLPLTLAVMEGVIARVDGQTVIAPLSAIAETFRVGAAEAPRRAAATLDVGVALGFRPAGHRRGGAVAILAETDAGPPRALLVDEIVDQRQVVIKSLEANYRATPGVSAATILPDGSVGLILDIDLLARRAATGPAAMALAG